MKVSAYQNAGEFIMKQHAKTRIMQHMTALLTQYPLDHITIKMICAHSDVHRTTFYDYFKDKYDLMDAIHLPHFKRYCRTVDYIKTHWVDFINEPEQCIRLFRMYFKYLKRHQQFYTAVLVTFPQKDIIEDYIITTRNVYRHILVHNHDIASPQHFVQYTIGGQLGLIYFWLREGCHNSPEMMAQTLYANLTRQHR